MNHFLVVVEIVEFAEIVAIVAVAGVAAAAANENVVARLLELDKAEALAHLYAPILVSK